MPLPHARPAAAPGTAATSAGNDEAPSTSPPSGASPAPELSGDVALVRKAIDHARAGRVDEATRLESSVSDPAARKLIEWVILRSDLGVRSGRYSAFIAANPGWPNHGLFRRRAEASLWTEDPKPSRVLAFFEGAMPLSAKGRLVLARALLAQGDAEGAAAQVRQAWRNESMAADLEKQVLEKFPGIINRTDHKARMETRLFAADNEAALRAAKRLSDAEVAIARARVALTGKGWEATKKKGKGEDSTKLLGAVPEAARHDPGYLFASARALRRDNKIAKAAEVMLAAPHDVAEVFDSEGWWIERRLLARKLLDIGDPRSAYLVMRDAAEPTYENSRVERHFMAGWIALRFLDDPATASEHFARIQQVSIHPTSLARSHYWLGRAAEALHRSDDARREFEAAAKSSAAYYGQLARARLGLGALALTVPPPPPEEGFSGERMEVARAVGILYELNERSLVIPFMLGVGEKLNDTVALYALGKLAEQREDPRGMLHMGRAALARGLPLEYYAFPTVGVPRYSPIGPGIETAMLFAIIRQESSFDPKDWSSAQAMGLMQVTPSAGKDTCKRFNCKYDVNRLKNDIPYNLQLGAAELGGVMQDYRGNCILAFAAYNAGRGRVAEWIKGFGDPRDPKVDPIDWVERIPIMETRNYVQRVMENFQVYRTRFVGNAPLTIEADLRRGGAVRN